MQVIRTTPEKGRTVFFDGTHYVKCWNNLPANWIPTHVKLLREMVPGYVHDYGGNWISYNIIKGVPASTLKHTPEFIDRVYKFCLENIKQTAPYVHGDWALSNMIVDGDNITMCDWDNLGIYPIDKVMEKLNADLSDAFGKAFEQYIQKA